MWEDDGTNDLLSFEEGECNVSDFCRVSIVEPKSTSKEELNLKPEAVTDHAAHDHIPRVGGTWTCAECGASNSNITADFCPVCGQKR